MQTNAPRAADSAGSTRRRPGERVAVVVLFAALALLGVLTLAPFLVPLAWTAIVGYITWPAYGLVRRAVPGRNLAALAMTVVVVALLALSAAWISIVLKDEVVRAVSELDLRTLTAAAERLVAALRGLPGIGRPLADVVVGLLGHPERLLGPIGRWLQGQSGALAAFAGELGRNLLQIGVAFLALFFLYRDGASWRAALRAALGRLIGEAADRYVDIVERTTGAVVYGLIVTALAQGLTAGVGYWLAGLATPALLGAFTALLALVPYGAVVVWGAASAWLALSGEPWTALGLAAWGAVIVGSVDNLIRPIVISRATHIHLLLVTLGVLGGLAAFGLIGIFVGPVILSVLLAAWQAWLAEGARAGAPPGPVRLRRARATTRRARRLRRARFRKREQGMR